MTATEIAAAIRAAIDRTGRFGAMDLIFATMPDDLRVLLDELDRLQHDHHQVRADAQARVDAAVVRALAAERERDTLRTRLAELEPVAWKRADWSGSESPTLQFDPPPDRPTVRDELTNPIWTPLYARPVPAIPADPGMLTVSMAPSSAYAMGWNDCRAKMLPAAPEAAR
jgi:hypothetical protein